MSVDKAIVSRIAELSRLEISEKDISTISEELANVISWIDILNEVNTNGVAPLSNVTGQKLPLREDIVTDGGYPERVLENSPEETSGFFVVPKVVE